MTRVQISGLRKSFGDAVAVAELSLSLADGEFVTLLGPSGCGKTTTLRCVGGLEHPDSGEITFDDETIVRAADGTFVPPEKRRLGMVFQSYAVWPHMTVRSNVAYPLRTRRIRAKEANRRVDETLELVGLGRYADRFATQLSGGQQQRVALARALVSEPRMLLFDEPLSNLDAKLRATMRSELRRAHDRVGTTSLYVTHDQVEALALSDRIVVMRDGEVQQIGAPAEIYWRPANPFVADFIGFDNVLTAKVAQRSSDAWQLRIMPSGAQLYCDPPGQDVAGDRVGVAVRASGIQIGDESTLDGRTNVLRGTVQRSTYLGEHFEYVVDVDGVDIIVRSEGLRPGNGASTPMSRGQQAWLHIPPEHIVVMADASNASSLDHEVPATAPPATHPVG